MNALKKIFFSIGVLVVLFGFSYSTANAQGRNISLQVFYDELSYYGDWIDNHDYGYVWRPNVGRDFRPYYTNGRWIMTEYGNTWASDYEWGWGPFHYGRWFYDDYDGWLWIPDTVWGPAWVDWRTGNGYYGWMPLFPRLNVSINIGRSSAFWIFIPQRHIYASNYHSYWNPRRNVTIYNHTTIINNVYVNNNVRYNRGPRAEDIRRATRRDVQVHRINEVSRPGAANVTRNQVNIYRPQLDRNDRGNSNQNNTARPNINNDRGNSNVRPDRGNGNNDRGNPAIRPNSSQQNNNDRPNRGNSSSGSDRNNTAPVRPNSSQNQGGSSNARPERGESRPNTGSGTDRNSNSNPAPSRQAPSNRGESSRPSRTESRMTTVGSTERTMPTVNREAVQRQQSPASSSSRGERQSAPTMQRVERSSSNSSRASAPQRESSSRRSSSESGRAERSR